MVFKYKADTHSRCREIFKFQVADGQGKHQRGRQDKRKAGRQDKRKAGRQDKRKAGRQDKRKAGRQDKRHGKEFYFCRPKSQKTGVFLVPVYLSIYLSIYSKPSWKMAIW